MSSAHPGPVAQDGQVGLSLYSNYADRYAQSIPLLMLASKALYNQKKIIEKTQNNSEDILERFPYQAPAIVQIKEKIYFELQKHTRCLTYWTYTVFGNRDELHYYLDDQPKFGVKPAMQCTSNKFLMSLATVVDGHAYDWKMDFTGADDFPHTLDGIQDAGALLKNVYARILAYSNKMNAKKTFRERKQQERGQYARPTHVPRQENDLRNALATVRVLISEVSEKIRGGTGGVNWDRDSDLGTRFSGDDRHTAHEVDGDVTHNPNKRIRMGLDGTSTAGVKYHIDLLKQFPYRRPRGFHINMENHKTTNWINSILPHVSKGWYEVVITYQDRDPATHPPSTFKLQLVPWERRNTTWVRPFALIANDSQLRSDTPIFNGETTLDCRDLSHDQFEQVLLQPYLIQGKGSEIDAMVHSLRVFEHQNMKLYRDRLRASSMVDYTDPATGNTTRAPRIFNDTEIFNYMRAYFSSDAKAGVVGDRSVFFYNVQGVVVGVEMSSPSLPPHVDYQDRAWQPREGVPHRGQQPRPAAQQPAPGAPGWYNAADHAPARNYRAEDFSPNPPAPTQSIIGYSQEQVNELIDQMERRLEKTIKDGMGNAPSARPDTTGLTQDQLLTWFSKMERRLEDTVKRVAAYDDTEEGQEIKEAIQRSESDAWRDTKAMVEAAQNPHASGPGSVGSLQWQSFPAPHVKSVLNGFYVAVSSTDPNQVPKRLIMKGAPDPQELTQTADEIELILQEEWMESARKQQVILYANAESNVLVTYDVQERGDRSGPVENEVYWKVVYRVNGRLLVYQKTERQSRLIGNRQYTLEGTKIQTNIEIAWLERDNDIKRNPESSPEANHMSLYVLEIPATGNIKTIKSKSLRVRGYDEKSTVSGRYTDIYNLQVYPLYRCIPYVDISGLLPNKLQGNITLHYFIFENGKPTEVRDVLEGDLELLDCSTPEFNGKMHLKGTVDVYEISLTHYLHDGLVVWGVRGAKNGETPKYIAHMRSDANNKHLLTQVSEGLNKELKYAFNNTWTILNGLSSTHKPMKTDPTTKRDLLHKLSVELVVVSRDGFTKRIANKKVSGDQLAENKAKQQSDIYCPMAFASIKTRPSIYSLHEHFKAYLDERRNSIVHRQHMYILRLFAQEHLAKLQERLGKAANINSVPQTIKMVCYWFNGLPDKPNAKSSVALGFSDPRDEKFSLVDLQGPVYVSGTGRFMLAPHLCDFFSSRDGAQYIKLVTWCIFRWNDNTAEYELLATKMSGRRSNYLINDPDHKMGTWVEQKENSPLGERQYDATYKMTHEFSGKERNNQDEPVCIEFFMEEDEKIPANPFHFFKRFPDYTVPRKERQEGKENTETPAEALFPTQSVHEAIAMAAKARGEIDFAHLDFHAANDLKLEVASRLWRNSQGTTRLRGRTDDSNGATVWANVGRARKEQATMWRKDDAHTHEQQKPRPQAYRRPVAEKRELVRPPYNLRLHDGWEVEKPLHPVSPWDFAMYHIAEHLIREDETHKEKQEKLRRRNEHDEEASEDDDSHEVQSIKRTEWDLQKIESILKTWKTNDAQFVLQAEGLHKRETLRILQETCVEPYKLNMSNDDIPQIPLAIKTSVKYGYNDSSELLFVLSDPYKLEYSNAEHDLYLCPQEAIGIRDSPYVWKIIKKYEGRQAVLAVKNWNCQILITDADGYNQEWLYFMERITDKVEAQELRRQTVDKEPSKVWHHGTEISLYTYNPQSTESLGPAKRTITPMVPLSKLALQNDSDVKRSAIDLYRNYKHGVSRMWALVPETRQEWASKIESSVTGSIWAKKFLLEAPEKLYECPEHFNVMITKKSQKGERDIKISAFYKLENTRFAEWSYRDSAEPDSDEDEQGEEEGASDDPLRVKVKKEEREDYDVHMVVKRITSGDHNGKWGLFCKHQDDEHLVLVKDKNWLFEKVFLSGSNTGKVQSEGTNFKWSFIPPREDMKPYLKNYIWKIFADGKTGGWAERNIDVSFMVWVDKRIPMLIEKYTTHFKAGDHDVNRGVIRSSYLRRDDDSDYLLRQCFDAGPAPARLPMQPRKLAAPLRTFAPWKPAPAGVRW